MGFELKGHTADVAVEARGESIDAVFASIADGLAAASSDAVDDYLADPSNPTDSLTVAVEAESDEALLFDFLDELIYRRDVDDVLPVDHSVTVDVDGDRWSLEARSRTIPIERIDAREIKAVTYSEMRLEETGDGWEAYVVFDV